MQKLITGIHAFQTNHFGTHRQLFEQLSRDGQSPEALFITCSDSRIVPTLLTQSQPGDLFIIRNAGNIVPPYGASGGGEIATVEYAVSVLGVEHIILCGHSSCGAMQALLDEPGPVDLPAVRQWLQHAEATRRIVRDNYPEHLDASDKRPLVSLTAQENALVQLENLRTHPAVVTRLARGTLNLHAWFYKIETGEVFTYDPGIGQYTPVTSSATGIPAATRRGLLDPVRASMRPDLGR